MSFQGYLMSFGGVPFPNKYLTLSSYTITPNQRLESEAYRDANGLTHRATLPNYKTKIDFSTKVNLKQSGKQEIFDVFSNGLVIGGERERKYQVTYWNFETDDYSTGYFYMPDVEYTIKRIDNTTNELYYEPIRFAFIEY